MKVVKAERIDYRKFDHLKPKDDTCMIQSDTDSMYMSADELFQKTPDMSDEKFMKGVDHLFCDFWSCFLTEKANREGVADLIKFGRENMFGSFLSIEKKMYIGTIIDSEAKGWIGYDNPEKKIQGVSLKKSAMPKYCRKLGIPLIMDITKGISKQEADKEIVSIYKGYKKESINNICSNGSIGDYKKYIKYNMKSYFDKPILDAFDKGWSSNAKMAFSYNYILEKFNLPLTPIASGEKFNFVYVKPTNKFNINKIAFVDEYPEEFKDMFTIDTEMCFRKFFLSIFDTVYNVLGWKSPKEVISLNYSSLDFLSR